MELVKEGIDDVAIQEGCMATLDTGLAPVPLPPLTAENSTLAYELRQLEEDFLWLLERGDEERRFILDMQAEFITLQACEDPHHPDNLRSLNNLCASWRRESARYHATRKDCYRLCDSLMARLADMQQQVQDAHGDQITATERQATARALAANSAFLARAIARHRQLAGNVALIDDAVLMLSTMILPALAETRAMPATL